MTLVYCSGPLFCPEEIGGMTAIARAVETAGHETFLPHRDGLEAYVMRLASTPLGSMPGRALVDRAIFALDVFQIAERAHCVVVNMNGRVPDEGAVAEAAIAFAIGTPVVLYKNDARAPFGGGDNAMLLGLAASRPVSTLAAIPEAVARAMSSPRSGPGARSAGLERAVSLGRKIWPVLDAVNRRRSQKRPDELIEHIVEICRVDE